MINLLTMFRKCKSTRADDLSPKKQLLSPTPKSVQKKSNGFRKVLLCSIAIFISTLVVLCLVSYQQGKLEDNVNELPKEVRDRIEIWYDGAKGQVKTFANKIHVGDKSLAMVLFGDDVEVKLKDGTLETENSEAKMSKDESLNVSTNNQKDEPLDEYVAEEEDTLEDQYMKHEKDLKIVSEEVIPEEDDSEIIEEKAVPLEVLEIIMT